MIYKVALGSYAAADQKGIQILACDSHSGRVTFLNGIAGVENPSFLAVDSHRQRLFAASEKPDGEVVAFHYDDASGDLREINRRKTAGSDPAYIAVDATGRWLLGVHYSSGSIFVFSIGETGEIAEMTEHIQLSGKGIRSDRQEGPHPHGIFHLPATNFWLVPDLGTDRLLVYQLDSGSGELIPRHTTLTQPGAGPRHIACHPTHPFVYVIQELASSVAAFHYDRESGKLSHLQEDMSLLPENFTGQSTAADIHISPSGRFLYGSNRGHDSLAVFSIQPDGQLTFITHYPTGRTPRNFLILPDVPLILVANQQSHTIMSLRYGESGIPISSEESYTTKHPVCLQIL